MKYGIAISTRNRYDTFKQTYEAVLKYAPEGAKIVVVDDCSDIPVPEATYRFEERAGIARVKNMCLALIDDCEHKFLLDDDCRPKCPEAFTRYAENKEPHLMYIFQDFANGRKLNDTILLYENDDIKAWSHARGCMCYYHKSCIDKVGGMDESFGIWGFEHPQLSDRIYNVGLTSFRYMDVHNSNELWHSEDEHQTVTSTCDGAERVKQIQRNVPLYKSKRDSKEFVPYKKIEENNIVITTYFTNVIDHQRNKHFAIDFNEITPLIDSAKAPLLLLHDCFSEKDIPETIRHEKVKTSESPYFQRWISIYQHLRENKYDKVFIVDATDVEMLRNPFPEMNYGVLYVGDEEAKTSNDWMLREHPNAEIVQFIKNNADKKLLNAGLCGSDHYTLLSFLHDIMKIYFDNKADIFYKHVATVGKSDMGVFNYVARTFYSDILRHGSQVNTRFKFNERNNKSWFKHK